MSNKSKESVRSKFIILILIPVGFIVVLIVGKLLIYGPAKVNSEKKNSSPRCRGLTPPDKTLQDGSISIITLNKEILDKKLIPKWSLIPESTEFVIRVANKTKYCVSAVEVEIFYPKFTNLTYEKVKSKEANKIYGDIHIIAPKSKSGFAYDARLTGRFEKASFVVPLDKKDLMVIKLFLVISLVSGILTAAVAFAKGRNFIGWFLFGMVLTVLGLIFVIVLPGLDKGGKKVY